MTSHYHQRLLQGEKELAEKLRPLVKTLRKQFDTKEEQAVCLQELGELYLKAGFESKNGKDFTKAAALFNAALVRTSKEEVQKKIKGHLVAVRQDFMKAFYPDAKLILEEQWDEIRMQNIHTLEKIRTNIKVKSHSFKLLMDRYDIKAKNLLEMETCLVSEAKKVTLLVQEDMHEFIRLLWNQSIAFSNGIPPCKYSMMGLGSLARQEGTPYSDLEFAILVEQDSDDVQRYFENLTNLFHLYVLDLGETPIPQMAIPSLNDFVKPGGDWFYDKITPSGFKLDGEMPWACKTPTGRQATCNKSGLSFIKTPVEMAELLKDDSVLGQSYRVAEVLRRAIRIIGDIDLYDIYQQGVIKISYESDMNLLTSKALAINHYISDSYRDTPYPNAKGKYYRFTSVFVESMRHMLVPTFQGGSQWCIIEGLTEMEKLSEEDALELKVVIALAYGVRLFTYFTNRGQREKMRSNQFTRDPGMKSINIKMRLHFPLFVVRILTAYYAEEITSRELEMVTKRHPLVVNSVAYLSQIVQLMEDSRMSPRNHPFILKFYCMYYFILASDDKASHGLPCRDTCQRKKLYALDWEILDISDLDFLLKNTHLCECVSLVKTYLEVHKYCTQKVLELPTGPPDVLLNCTFEELSTCTAERDVLFLNFNLLKLANFSTDVTVLKHVVKTVEKFLNTGVQRLTEKRLHKEKFYHMEFDFYWYLKRLYEFLVEDEKLTNLLERWTDILEKRYPDGDFDIEYIGIYTALGRSLLENSEQNEEAIRFSKKAFQRLENEVISNSSIDKPDYKSILASSVITFAEVLVYKQGYEECEALVKEYFDDNKYFSFANEEIIDALLVLARCYFSSKKWVKSIEVCEKIHHMVKDEGAGEHLYARRRTDIGNSLFNGYIYCGKIIDLPKAAEFHKLACNIQKDKVFAVLEHKIFLLTSALQLFGLGPDSTASMGFQYAKQALALDNPTTHTKMPDFSKTDMWIHILVVLCDALNSFTSSVDMAVLFDNYGGIAVWLRKFSKFKNSGLVCYDLYETYVDYRLCHCLFSIAMDPDTSFALKLKETTDYLYQTQTRLMKFFPKCATAIKWCKDARFHLNPKAESKVPQDHIDLISLINDRQMHAHASVQREDVFLKCFPA